MDFKKTITARFLDAIKKAFPHPTPLIGERWFVFPPTGEPADFQFVGTRKLAKASGIPAAKVARLLTKNLDMSRIDAQVHVEPDGRILVRLNEPVPPC